ncbi:hypothetical protein [Paenibacillus sophorae]|nr:hypothetical protein [Paenibacillus sophorae]
MNIRRSRLGRVPTAEAEIAVRLQTALLKGKENEHGGTKAGQALM